MIIKGDKIKLVQKIGNFDKVGDVFEITGVDDGIVSFSCGYGTGCMTYEEFENYFKKLNQLKRDIEVNGRAITMDLLLTICTGIKGY